MSYELMLRVFDNTNTLRYSIVNPLGLHYERHRYGGSMRFSLNAANDVTPPSTLQQFDVVEIWWRNKTLGIQSAAGGFVRLDTLILRDWALSTDEFLTTIWEGVCLNAWHILDWRRILWPSGTANRSTFTNTPAETVGKTLATYNATAAASVVNGRWRSGDLSPTGFAITVAPDAGAGSNITRTTNMGVLREILEQIAYESGGGFTLTRNGDLLEWELGFSAGQQGVDRTSNVIFALYRGNMGNPSLTITNTGSPTVAVAAGQGEEADRLVGIATSASWSAGFDVEGYVDARQVGSVTGLQQEASAHLVNNAPTSNIRFAAIQTVDTFFSPTAVTGRNTYDVGDLVSIDYQGFWNKVVSRVSLDWRAAAPVKDPSITIEFEDF